MTTKKESRKTERARERIRKQNELSFHHLCNIAKCVACFSKIGVLFYFSIRNKKTLTSLPKCAFSIKNKRHCTDIWNLVLYLYP